MNTDLEWTIEQEALLRSCHMEEEQLSLITYLLELDSVKIASPFSGKDLIRKVSLKGQTITAKPLPVTGLEYLINNHKLDLTTSRLTISHQWFEGRPWNFSDFIDPDVSVGSQLEKLTQRVELIYECEEGVQRLRGLIVVAH